MAYDAGPSTYLYGWLLGVVLALALLGPRRSLLLLEFAYLVAARFVLRMLLKFIRLMRGF